MKIYERRRSFGNIEYYGRQNNFEFDICQSYDTSKWYVVATHAKKDVRYNSLWEKIEFKSLEDAGLWCENFDHEDYKCLGSDIYN